MVDERAWARRARWVRGVALAVIVAALVAIGLPIAPRPAAAADPPDPETAAVEAGLQQLAGFLVQLGGVGAFGQVMAPLTATPGGPSGLDLAAVFASVLTPADFGDATNVCELVDRLDAVDTGTVAIDAQMIAPQPCDTSAAGVHQIALQVTADRQVDTGLDLTSATPRFDFHATSGVQLDLHMTSDLVVAYDPATQAFWTESNPTLTVDAAASIPNPARVNSAVGILGVDLDPNASTFTMNATYSTTVADPDNDGRLSPGELAKPGAAEGLVTVDTGQGNLAATLAVRAAPSAHYPSLQLPDASATVTLTSNDLTSPPTVAYTAGSPATFAGFQTLTPGELASAVARLAVALNGATRANGVSVDLPFMKGVVGDAVTANEALVAFLEQNVHPTPGDPNFGPGDDPALAGRPRFASFQQLLDALAATDAPGGASVEVRDVAYTGSTSKLAFTIGIHREPGTEQPLDPVGPQFAGGGAGSAVTYTGTTLTDPDAAWTDDQWAGRVVAAGASIARVKTNTATTLTLDDSPFSDPKPASLWKDTIPVDSTAYVISGPDPQTGQVTFANTLTAQIGVRNANATVPQATVDPSYDVTLPVVLDLRTPVTGAACADADPVANPNHLACPYQLDDPTGTATTAVVSELPLPPDRVLLRTGGNLLTADAAIHTPVEVDGSAGFVKVRLGGTLDVAPANGQHLLTIDLATPPQADADRDVRLSTAFGLFASDPASLLTSATHARASADLTATVPDAPDFFPAGATHATVAWADATDPATLTVTPGDLSRLRALDFDPEFPDSLGAALVTSLDRVDEAVEQLPAAVTDPTATTRLPLLGVSFTDLAAGTESGGGASVTYTATSLTDTAKTFADMLVGRQVTAGTMSGTVTAVSGNTLTIAESGWDASGATPPEGTGYRFRSDLHAAVADLAARQPANLQDLLASVREHLGNGTTVAFSVDPASDTGDPMLRLTLDWQRRFAVASPVSFTFPLDPADGTLAGTSGTVVTTVADGSHLRLTLLYPLTTAAVDATDPAAALRVDPARSSLDVRATASQDGQVLTGQVGPLSVSLGDPRPESTKPQTSVRADVAATIADTTDTAPAALDDFIANLAVRSLNQGTVPVTCPADAAPGSTPLALCAVLPAYETSDGTTYMPLSASGNDFVLRVPQALTLAAGEPVGLDGELSPTDPTPRFTAPDNLSAKINAASFDYSSLQAGLDAYLDGIQQQLEQAGHDGKIPLVGDDLQQGLDFVGRARAAVDATYSPRALPNGGTLTSTGQIRTYVGERFQDALTTQQVLPPGGSVDVELTCDIACGPGTDVPAYHVHQVDVTVDLGQGAQTFSQPLDFGLPGIKLHPLADAGDQVSGNLAWSLHLAFRLDKTDGFSVRADDTADPELRIDVDAGLTDTDGGTTAQMGYITVAVVPNVEPGGNPGFVGTIVLDIYPDGSPVTIPELVMPNAKTFRSAIEGDVAIDWKLDGHADVHLPGLGVTLKVAWSIGGGGHHEAPDSIELVDGTFDVAALMDSYLGPVFKQIRKVTRPIQPVIDALFAPMPGVSDLSTRVGGPEVSLAGLAKTFNSLTGGPNFGLIDTLLYLSELVSLINGVVPGTGEPLDLGSYGFEVFSAVTVPQSNKSVKKSLTAIRQPAQTLKNQFKNRGPKFGGEKGGVAVIDFASQAGFRIPLLEDPAIAIGMLLGEDVTIAEFDSGALTLGFQFEGKFGPLIPPYVPLFATVAGYAAVTAHIIAGFDTYGIRKGIESGDGVAFLDSLFFRTVDEAGEPFPVFFLIGDLTIGAKLDLTLASAGIEGGFDLEVSVFWHDPNSDGKFRFGEFLAAALTNPLCLFDLEGVFGAFLRAVVTIGRDPFSITIRRKLASVHLVNFSVTPDCSPPEPRLGRVVDDTLYIYSGKLGTTEFRGDKAWDSHGTADEDITVRQNHDHATGAPIGFTINNLGTSEDFPDPEGRVRNVVLDAVTYDDFPDPPPYTGDLKVKFEGDTDQTELTGPSGQLPRTFPFTATVFFRGGAGNDQVDTGSGPAFVDGGPGDDRLVTHERPDLSVPSGDPSVGQAVVAGGPGDDEIQTGDGNAWVAGDGALTFGTWVFQDPDGNQNGGVVDPHVAVTRPDPSLEATDDGDDRIALGLGASIAFGGGGADTIDVTNDSPLAVLHTASAADHTLYAASANTLVGGSGDDQLRGGSGDDTLFGGPQVIVGPDDGGPPDGTNIIDTGTGNDVVYGAAGADYVAAGSLGTFVAAAQHTTVFGAGGDDVLMGAAGTDAVYGGPGDDYVLAEPSDVGPVTGADGFGPARTIVHRPNLFGPQPKLLVGGQGSDHIVGGDGGATVFGDTMADPCPAAGEHPTASDGRDLITGGAGVETVDAGGHDDLVVAGAGNDVVCGNAGNDAIGGGAGADSERGGSGNDAMRGDAGTDTMFGNDGDDTLYGNESADAMEGNNGRDTLYGGGGDDVMLGGTSAAGQPDQGDDLAGDTGNDQMVGDNGRILDSVLTPLDLDGTVAGAGRPDAVAGGDGDDHGYGGLAADRVNGGAGEDHLEGNNDADTVSGDAGADDVIGGSSESRPDGSDHAHGGDGDDVVTGDNAVIDPGSTSALVAGRDVSRSRGIQLLDLGYGPTAGTSGADTVTGDAGGDIVFGQGGDDLLVSGGSDDDYAEGGAGADTITGDGGEDDLVGGSWFVDNGTGESTHGQPDAGDRMTGGAGGDVVLSDNGAVVRDPAAAPSDLTKNRGITLRSVTPYDLGDAPHAGSAGDDTITGDDGNDMLLAQAGADHVSGGTGDDYAEGGQDGDQIDGDAGDDDLAGGGSSVHGTATGDSTEGQHDGDDAVSGGPGDDVITGDNASVTRLPLPDGRFFPDRIGTTVAGQRATQRSLTLLDLAALAAGRYGNDNLSGGPGVDVAFGQDGDDTITGGGDDDQLEGNGDDDTISGDDGQDDILGGSARPGFRDGNDLIHGNGDSDFALGDNGSLARVIRAAGGGGGLADALYAQRYPIPAPAGAAKLRVAADGNASTRFCTTAQPTCEPAGAFGHDTIFGDDGDDVAYGQDGNDSVDGGAGDDDLYGELGDDTLSGAAGDDAMLGDRGGIVDIREDGSRQFTKTVTSPPAVSFTGLTAGTVSRRVDLAHDVNGDQFVGGATSPAMPYAGMTSGGNDAMRGGPDHDTMHGGVGDDLMNGDSGGDWLFGDDGADVMWGGKGSEDPANPNDRGPGDSLIDHLVGGKGATSGPAVAGLLGSDVIDFRPRGTYPGGCAAGPWPETLPSGQTVDPCRWFEMTGTDVADPALHQHHEGIDWIYGGWDRDVMQADVADNGPNPGDRLIDWSGAYNLYTHCNAAYGGFGDVRLPSPAMISFLEQWAYGLGAGQGPSDVTTDGTSAFDELALVYQADNKDHGTGKAFPATPGHFFDAACTP